MAAIGAALGCALPPAQSIPSAVADHGFDERACHSCSSDGVTRRSREPPRLAVTQSTATEYVSTPHRAAVEAEPKADRKADPQAASQPRMSSRTCTVTSAVRASDVEVKPVDDATLSSVVKGAWGSEEDTLLVELVNEIGAKKWSQIAQRMPGRVGKQVRMSAGGRVGHGVLRALTTSL